MNAISNFSFECDKNVQSLRAELLAKTAKRHFSRLAGLDGQTISNAPVDLDSFVFEKTVGMKQSLRTHVLMGMPSHGSYLSARSILIATQPIVNQIMQSEADWSTSSQTIVTAMESLLSKLDSIVFLDRQARDASIGLSHFVPFQLIEPFPIYLTPKYDSSSVKMLIMDYGTGTQDVSQYLPEGIEVCRLSDASTRQGMLDLIQDCQIHIHLDYQAGAPIDVVGPLDSLFNGFFTVICPTQTDKTYSPGGRVAQAAAERSYATVLKEPKLISQICVDFNNRLQLTSQLAATTPPEISGSKMKNEMVFQNTRRKLEKVLPRK